MTTPSAFKIMSLSTSSAFEPKQKANPPQCGTFTLALNPSLGNTIVYGGIPPYTSTNLPPLNLTGVCKVVLPDYGILPGIDQQYRIQNVIGCVPGQIITFINKNTAKYFSFDFSTIANNISYSPGVSTGTKVLKNVPVIGSWNTNEITINVTSGGTYSIVPTGVVIGGGTPPANGTLATATVTLPINPGPIVIAMTNPGLGYTTVPPVTLTGGTSSVAATPTAVLNPVLIVNGAVV